MRHRGSNLELRNTAVLEIDQSLLRRLGAWRQRLDFGNYSHEMRAPAFEAQSYLCCFRIVKVL